MDKLLIALVSLLFGAFLARRTQREQWLLDRKAEVFSRYLEKYDEAFVEAAPFTGEQKNDPKKVMDIYQPLITQAKLVRLYIDPSVRDEFSHLTKDLWALHPNVEFGDSRFITIDHKLQRIQEIFENELAPRAIKDYLYHLAAMIGWSSNEKRL